MQDKGDKLSVIRTSSEDLINSMVTITNGMASLKT